MNHYMIKTPAPHRHYLDVRMTTETHGHPLVYLRLPAWRPGRYELANYAKNIQYWRVFDNNGRSLPFEKVSKDYWKVTTLGAALINIHYNYFAFQLDAGGSYFDENQLYINPVNCLLYVPGRLQEPCTITLEVPSNYIIASALKFDSNRTAKAFSYHELADSPIIASAGIQQNEYTVENVKFRITFQGTCKPFWEKIIKDFKTFSLAHIRLFGSMPVNEFHFLFQVSTYPAYHGVEHSKSCVIHFGSGEEMMNDTGYKSFLGICSHELFHCWNIKAIRPTEFMEYDYSKEVYSYLGYMAEGVTSYYGDLQLLRCGIYDWNDYSSRMSANITNYFHTEGRNYQSLAASSFETWLHGYSADSVERTVSMYVKGMLFTLLKDVALRRTNSTGRSMDWIMQTLYRNFGLERKGYSITDIERMFVDNADENYKNFFMHYFWGIAPYDIPLQESFAWLGCELHKLPSPRIYERFYGIKMDRGIITQIAPGSPADQSCLSVEDELIALNQQEIKGRPEALFEFYHGQPLKLNICRKKQFKEIALTGNGSEYFPIYQLNRLSSQNPLQKRRFQLWSNQT